MQTLFRLIKNKEGGLKQDKNIPAPGYLMYMRLRVLILTLSMMTFIALGQNAKVMGVVKNTSKEAIPFATVSLMETGQTGVTDNDGRFVFEKLELGLYHIQLDVIGYKHFTKTFNLKNNSNLNIGTIILEDTSFMMDEMVITATRTERNQEDVPTPVTVISGEDIESMGSMRLSDVLAEQTGLAIVSDHGQGLQVQGFDADYTLIMINGQPIVGRTGGTLDLSRITVSNIKQIEITKGPSSSLYGSEALAGVVNIITEDPKEGISSSVGLKYRTYNTVDLNADVQAKKGNLGTYLQVNWYSSQGYDLTPESISKTSPEFTNYTVNGDLTYKLSEKSKLRVNGRYYTQKQHDQSDLEEENSTKRLNFEGIENDWNITPTLIHDFTPHTRLTLLNYSMGYNTRSNYHYEADGSVYEKGFFNQFYNKTEAQTDIRWSNSNVLTLGAGYILETLRSDRYNGLNTFNTSYGFLQNEWAPFNNRLTILAGARFDTHSEYASQLSPKLAAQYKLTRWFHIRGAFGTGFKAPDFRQLFLDFTNPTAGYTVLGSSVVASRMQELEAEGQIQTILIDYNSINTIQAESSISYNFGFDLRPHKKVILKVNFFRNDIQDLIESSPIAVKTNGQSVYSYFNISRVYTQGMEGELRVKLNKSFKASVGYQYLEAKDKDVIEQLENGEIKARDPQTFRTVNVSTEDYGGLFNRSKHSGTAKIFYTNYKYKFNISLRAIYRGPFGFGDVNDNGILDDRREYTEGYTTWHFSLIKRLLPEDMLSLQFGVDNVFETTNEYVPSMPGRFLYAGATIRFSKKDNQETITE